MIIMVFSIVPLTLAEETEEEQVVCTEEVMECPDGSFVGRDSENGCEFFECPETEDDEDETDDEDEVEEEEETDDEDETDDIEEEAEEYEEEETGDEVIEEVEEELETDEEIIEELEITEEELAEIDEAIEKIGLRVYILNRMLKCKLRARIAEGNAIIDYLADKEVDGAELKEIVDDLAEILESVDPKTMTKEEHEETVESIKELVAIFKEKARELIPEENVEEVRKLIKKHHDRAIKECSKLLWKAKELHNRKQFRNAMREVIKDAKELRKDGKKLLDAAARLRNLNKIKNDYKKGEVMPEDIKELGNKWKNETKKYGLDRAASVVKNERAQLAIGSAQIRRAIREAEEAGEDTTDLEAKLGEINSQIKEFVPGKVTSEEAKAKAATIKSRLENLKKNQNLIQRVRADPIKVKNLARAKDMEVKEQIKNGDITKREVAQHVVKDQIVRKTLARNAALPDKPAAPGEVDTE